MAGEQELQITTAVHDIGYKVAPLGEDRPEEANDYCYVVCCNQ